MPVFSSRVDTASAAFAKNRADMLALVDELRTLERRAVAASNRRAATFEARGQLTPRERLARLLDPGMPFLRLHTLSNYLLEDDNPETSVPGGSAIPNCCCMFSAVVGGRPCGKRTPQGRSVGWP